MTLRGRQLEFVPALFLMLWGLWVLLPFPIGALKGTPFVLMIKLMPEWVWGLLYLSAGIAQAAFIFIASIKIRQYTSFVSIWFLLALAIFSIISNPYTVAAPTYFSIAFCEWLAYTEIIFELKGKK